MTAILTMVLLVVLFVIIALPGVAAVARPSAAVVAVPFYLILLTGLFFHYVGLSFGGRLPASAQAGPGPSSLCERALAQSEQAGLILDRSNPLRVTVRGELWGELPEQAQQALVQCLQSARPAELAERPIAIVEVPGN